MNILQLWGPSLQFRFWQDPGRSITVEKGWRGNTRTPFFLFSKPVHPVSTASSSVFSYVSLSILATSSSTKEDDIPFCYVPTFIIKAILSLPTSYRNIRQASSLSHLSHIPLLYTNLPFYPKFSSLHCIFSLLSFHPFTNSSLLVHKESKHFLPLERLVVINRFIF